MYVAEFIMTYTMHMQSMCLSYAERKLFKCEASAASFSATQASAPK